MKISYLDGFLIIANTLSDLAKYDILSHDSHLLWTDALSVFSLFWPLVDIVSVCYIEYSNNYAQSHREWNA